MTPNPSEMRELARRLEGGYTLEDVIPPDAWSDVLEAQRKHSAATASAAILGNEEPEEPDEPDTVQRDHLEEYERAMIVHALRVAADERQAQIEFEAFSRG